MDGYEATAELRSMNCRVAIVGVTANAMAEQVAGVYVIRHWFLSVGSRALTCGIVRAEFIARGASAVLTKPLRLEDLNPLLEAVGL